MVRRKRRRRRFYKVRWGRLLTCIGVLTAFICLVIFTVNHFTRRGDSVLADAPSEQITSLGEITLQTEAQTQEPAGTIPPLDDGAEATAMPIDTPQPTQQPEEFRLLPIARRSGLEQNEGKVALTVDDCFQTQNVRKVLDMADKYKFKITFFPIGEVVKKNPPLWKEVYDRGHQIENHSFSHGDMTKLTDEEAYNEIFRQNEAINNALGVKYEMHFFRPMGGIGRQSVPLHKVLKDMGYFGVAFWSQVGTSTPKEILNTLQSGDVILFHTTNTDITKLNEVVPGVVDRGYQFITLNEMYNLEPNATFPLD